MEWEREVVIPRVTTDSLDKRVTELEQVVEMLLDTLEKFADTIEILVVKVTNNG